MTLHLKFSEFPEKKKKNRNQLQRHNCVGWIMTDGGMQRNAVVSSEKTWQQQEVVPNYIGYMLSEVDCR